MTVPIKPTREMKEAFWASVGVWVEEGRDHIDDLWDNIILAAKGKS